MYDLIVIGGGPGGYTGAIRAAKLGMKVALIEKDKVGGTCLNRGCIPTKALLHASAVFEEAKEGASIGISADGLSYDLPSMYAYKQQVVEKLRSGVESLLKSTKTALLRGTGTVTAPHTVAVSGESASARRIARTMPPGTLRW